MLQLIRDQLKGWVAVLIFTIMIIPFAFWGINYYFEQSGGIVALEVNGEDIMATDFQNAYQDRRRQWRETSGAPLSEEAAPLLKKQVADDLARTELLRQLGAREGLHVGDREVWKLLQDIPAFNDESGFNPLLFETMANRAGMTPAAFTARIKQDMVVEQLRDVFFLTNFVTPAEVSGYSELKRQSRDFHYALLSSDALKDAIEITDERIQSYYEGEGRYQEPEKVKLDYLVLSRARVAEDIYLEDGELETYFTENRRNYEVEETRRVEQILLRLPEEEPTEEETAAMKAKAEELHQLAAAGGGLEELVTEYAGEDADNIEFSEFGFLARGVLEPEVEEVVFALAAGEVGAPVQSRYGFHVAAVLEIKDGTQVTLADKRAEVEQDLRAERAAQQLYELTDRLATLAYESPDTLETAAEELELEIQESDLISRQEPGAGVIAEPGVLDAAFSDDVLLEGNNSDLIELDNERYLVLRVAQREPASKKPLEDVREAIITHLKYQDAREQTQQRGEEVLAKLKEGRSREDLAEEYSLEWRDAVGVGRDDADINRAVTRTAFKAGLPQPGEPRFGGASLGTGDYAVVIVRAVSDPGQDAVEQEELDALRNQLRQVQAAGGWAEFNNELRADASVTVYEEAL